MNEVSIKETRKSTIVALVCFVCVLMLVLAIAIGNIMNGSGNNATVLVMGIFLVVVPAGISFTLTCNAIRQIYLCRRQNIAVPRSLVILVAILVLQIPLFVLLLIGSSMIKPTITVKRVETYISEKYGDRYEILESCHHFDESINDYTKVVFRLDGSGQAIVAKYDWRNGKYQDGDVEPGC